MSWTINTFFAERWLVDRHWCGHGQLREPGGLIFSAEHLGRMQADVVVLGAGMVSASVAVHCTSAATGGLATAARRARRLHGNGGLVQREAVFPHPFPRDFAELRRIAKNRSVDVFCTSPARSRAAALCLLAHSEPRRYADHACVH